MAKLEEFVELATDVVGQDATRSVLVANWVVRGMEDLSSDKRREFLRAVLEKSLSNTIATQLLKELISSDRSVEEVLANLSQVDSGAIEEAVAQVMVDSPQEVERYRAGEAKLIGFFIGQVMSKMGGGAEPALVKEILDRLLTK